jgi:hypothetical protein
MGWKTVRFAGGALDFKFHPGAQVRSKGNHDDADIGSSDVC